MEKAEGVVFGAPNYWDGMNAKGRAFWERVCLNRFKEAGTKLAQLV